MTQPASQPKPKLLCLVHLPPPLHGVAQVSQYIVQSAYIASKFECITLPLRFTDKIDKIGTVSWKKFCKMAIIAMRLFIKILVHRPALVYFTIVPTGNAFIRDLLYVAILKLMRQPHIFHLHGKGIAKVTSPIRKRAYKWAFKSAKVIHLSELLYTDIQSYVPRKNCYFLPNGIPNVDVGVKKKHNFNILFLSNLMETKGPLILLEALSKLPDLDLTCTFAGQFSKEIPESRFDDAVSRLGLNAHINYVGPKYGEEKYRLFQAADLFVFPTYNDCYPLTLLEAMQFGIPIISTPEGAIPEIVTHNETGLIVPRRDADQLANAISTLYHNADLREDFSAAAKEKFRKNYSLERFEEGFVSIIRDCLSRSTDA